MIDKCIPEKTNKIPQNHIDSSNWKWDEFNKKVICILWKEEENLWFRKLIIKSIRNITPSGDSFLVDFENCAISLQINKEEYPEINNISKWDSLFIKWKNGNLDTDLWGFNVIEEIRFNI